MSDYPGFFSDAELADLPVDGLEAAEVIYERWSAFVAKYPEATEQLAQYDEFLRWGAIARLLLEKHPDFFRMGQPPVGTKPQDNINDVIAVLAKIGVEATAGLTKRRGEQAADKHYTAIAVAMGQRQAYVFADDDYTRIQTLMNELRSLITQSEDIHADHKQRLLRRLEQMQREIHKVVADLDRAMGFIIEATATLGQAAENLQPVMERLDELAQIITRVVTVPASFLSLFGQPSLPSSGEDAPPVLPSGKSNDGSE